MLIEIFHQKQPNQSEEEYKQILHAEIFIENLPSKEKRTGSKSHRFPNKAVRFGRSFSISAWFYGWYETVKIY